jgi:hypothetical protein
VHFLPCGEQSKHRTSSVLQLRSFQPLIVRSRIRSFRRELFLFSIISQKFLILFPLTDSYRGGLGTGWHGLIRQSYLISHGTEVAVDAST